VRRATTKEKAEAGKILGRKSKESSTGRGDNSTVRGVSRSATGEEVLERKQSDRKERGDERGWRALLKTST